MIYGLVKIICEWILEILCISLFLLNIDEVILNNNKYVLVVLVSYFFEFEGWIVLEYLILIEFVIVDILFLLEVIDEVFNFNGILWVNVVFIFMDLCVVMRGFKNGLEKKIRELKVLVFLDIDGDICYCLYNVSKKLCVLFDYWVEFFFIDFYIDYCWFVDLREKFVEVCEILGIKFIIVERFVSYRWMICYDIVVGILWFWDVYYVFYFGFLKLEDRKIYKLVIRKILNDRKVSEFVRVKLDSVYNYLKKKFMISDGKMRKIWIFEKVVYFLLKRYIIMEINMYDNV